MTADAAARPAAEIRRLLPDDWAAVREARLDALAQAPDAFASTLEREQAFDEPEWRRRLAGTAWFGAWAAGARAAGVPAGLAGVVAAFPETGPQAPVTEHATPGTWHLVAMWVSPAHRGQGIAEQLVAAVCDLARTQGADRVALWVADANPRARAVYRRLGFRLSGERGILRPGPPGEPGPEEARMTLDLRARPAG
jgi:ribosomal protein S18 acetylase RimI-like enzyme